MMDPPINRHITEPAVIRLAVYYYLVAIAWPAYLFVLPVFFLLFGPFVFFLMIFPGLFIFTWMGFLMHESWHKYVPNVNSKFFYIIFSIMLLSDPQLYNLIHRTHHGEIHSYDDAEFHPLGEIKSRLLRILYNWLEVVFGIAFLVGVATYTVPRDFRFSGKYRLWKLPIALSSGIAFYGGIALLSHGAFDVPLWTIAGLYAANVWLGSFFLHQSQLVEHGNLIVSGDFKRRNMQARNLKRSGVIEKIFLFLTHDDSREHVLHHTMTGVHSRPFPNAIPLPAQAVMISMADYARILRRMLIGRTDLL